MRFLISTAIAALLVTAGTGFERATAQIGGPAPVNPTGAAVKAFQERVQAWMAFRKKVDDGIPKLRQTTDPKEIADRERALAEAMIKGRPKPTVGEYFPTEFRALLASIVKEDFAKRTPAERKALIVELPKGLKFGINQIYPTSIPLATLPANLLAVLPDLPPELEYRIVHRHLILRDIPANYVVDMVPNLFPIPTS